MLVSHHVSWQFLRCRFPTSLPSLLKSSTGALPNSALPFIHNLLLNSNPLLCTLISFTAVLPSIEPRKQCLMRLPVTSDSSLPRHVASRRCSRGIWCHAVALCFSALVLRHTMAAPEARILVQVNWACHDGTTLPTMDSGLHVLASTSLGPLNYSVRLRERTALLLVRRQHRRREERLTNLSASCLRLVLPLEKGTLPNLSSQFSPGFHRRLLSLRPWQRYDLASSKPTTTRLSISTPTCSG